MCSPMRPPRLSTRTPPSTHKTKLGGMPGAPSASAAAGRRGAGRRRCRHIRVGDRLARAAVSAPARVHRSPRHLEPMQPVIERGDRLRAEGRPDHVARRVEEVGHRAAPGRGTGAPPWRAVHGHRVGGVRRGQQPRGRRIGASLESTPTTATRPCVARATVATAPSSARQSRTPRGEEVDDHRSYPGRPTATPARRHRGGQGEGRGDGARLEHGRGRGDSRAAELDAGGCEGTPDDDEDDEADQARRPPLRRPT